MWIKLLKDLFFEGNRKVPAGTILWSRRAGCVAWNEEKQQWKQKCSTTTIELDEFILVLDDSAEGELYSESEPGTGESNNDKIIYTK